MASEPVAGAALGGRPMKRKLASLSARLMRMVVASVVMGVVAWGASWALSPWLTGVQWQKLIALGLIVGTGMTAYAILTIILKATSLAEIKASFGKG